MKIRNILITGLGAVALTACNDYLEVDAPSKYTPELIYSSENEVNTALNGVYAKLLVSDLYGNTLYNGIMLNSDVDFTATSNETSQDNAPRRFDMTARGSSAEKLWNACYSGIETANEFINGLQNSELYQQETDVETTVDGSGNVTSVATPQPNDMTQKMGEAKVIRAMLYHKLLAYYGDVPFTMEPTSVTNEFLPDVMNRTEISDSLIRDLMEASEYMYSDKSAQISEKTERISQEAAWAMIARLALQAGGYSLNHVDENGNDLGSETYGVMTRPANYKEYYAIARDYAKKVIDAGGHALSKSYRDVFVDECNDIVATYDDPIFEIPFGQGETGNWGYYQGPTVESDGGSTLHSWGASSGSVRTTAFYRYDFEEGDTRRDFVCGMWYYNAKQQPVLRFDYAMHNNKWSKLWRTSGLGATSEGSTGINFAYIRYADVLLMFAEADNEVNEGPTQEAIDAVNQVRYRAFEGAAGYELSADATASKEAFLKAVLDERKLEFAGENMRWKDLVRNNLYAETIYYTFLTYYSVAATDPGLPTYYEEISNYNGKDYESILPSEVYAFYINNPGDGSFVNSTLPILYVANPYSTIKKPTADTPDKYIMKNPSLCIDKYGNPLQALRAMDITGNSGDSNKYEWLTSKCYTGSFGDSDKGMNAKAIYSFYGYIRGTDVYSSQIVIVRDGNPETIDPVSFDTANLPVLRYLMPYPQEIITRAAGKYKQYYGYK